MGVGERERAAAIAALREIGEAAATHSGPLPFGVALLNERFPHVWDLSALRVEDAQPRLDADSLVEAAERLFSAAGLPHRRAFVEDEATGERLAGPLRAAGWEAARLVLMVHDPNAPRPSLHAAAEEVPERARRGAAEAFFRADEQTDLSGEQAIRQLIERELALPPHMRRNVAAFDDGELVSYCDMRLDGRAAQIEHVTTLKGHEGRGLASAVVLHAVDLARAAGHEVVFLLALADDWPRKLYEKLGFRTVASPWDMVRKPSAVSARG